MLMADRRLSTRQRWFRTVLANLGGIALILIGWAADSGPIVLVGFLVLVATFVVRVYFGFYFPRRKQRQ